MALSSFSPFQLTPAIYTIGATVQNPRYALAKNQMQGKRIL